MPYLCPGEGHSDGDQKSMKTFGIHFCYKNQSVRPFELADIHINTNLFTMCGSKKKAIPPPREDGISNRPFPSSGLSLSQNESSCETFHMKMSLICMKMNL